MQKYISLDLESRLWFHTLYDRYAGVDEPTVEGCWFTNCIPISGDRYGVCRYTSKTAAQTPRGSGMNKQANWKAPRCGISNVERELQLVIILGSNTKAYLREGNGCCIYAFLSTAEGFEFAASRNQETSKPLNNHYSKPQCMRVIKMTRKKFH